MMSKGGMNKNIIPVILAAFFAILMISIYFINYPPLGAFASESQKMFVSIVAAAVVVGGINLVLFHSKNIIKKRRDWDLSVVCLGTFLFYLIITLLPGYDASASYLFSKD